LVAAVVEPVGVALVGPLAVAVDPRSAAVVVEQVAAPAVALVDPVAEVAAVVAVTVAVVEEADRLQRYVRRASEPVDQPLYRRPDFAPRTDVRPASEPVEQPAAPTSPSHRPSNIGQHHRFTVGYSL
jgi:hypothetical protein